MVHHGWKNCIIPFECFTPILVIDDLQQLKAMVNWLFAQRISSRINLTIHVIDYCFEENLSFPPLQPLLQSPSSNINKVVIQKGNLQTQSKTFPITIYKMWYFLTQTKTFAMNSKKQSLAQMCCIYWIGSMRTASPTTSAQCLLTFSQK